MIRSIVDLFVKGTGQDKVAESSDSDGEFEQIGNCRRPGFREFICRFPLSLILVQKIEDLVPELGAIGTADDCN